MVVLNIDHPDIEEFIKCKVEEEKKAWALIEAGYDSSLDGPAYGSVFFQNANNSVRVTDDFMRAIIENRPWSTRYITTNDICETFQARDLLQKIAEATWRCGGGPGPTGDVPPRDATGEGHAREERRHREGDEPTLPRRPRGCLARACHCRCCGLRAA